MGMPAGGMRMRALGTGVAAALVMALVAALAGCAPAGSNLAVPSTAGAAQTLRTLIDAPPTAPALTVGAEVARTDAYVGYAASYLSQGVRITAVLGVPTTAGPHPGVVVVHGSVDAATFTTGSGLLREQEALVRAGMIVLTPDLRNLGGSDRIATDVVSTWVGQVADVVTAGRALAASGLPSLAADRISLLGHSLGGMMSFAASAIAPDLWKAVAMMSPASTNLDDGLHYLLPADDGAWPGITARWGTPATQPQLWADLSPECFAARTRAPLLVVGGGAEASPFPEWAAHDVQVWRAAGADVTFTTAAGANHQLDPVWDQVFPTQIVPWLLART